MWLCALLALVALHGVESLRSSAFSDNPSALSNIELLIPLALPRQPENSDQSSEEEDERQSREPRDHDEPFSSIPGYAFTLDTQAHNNRNLNTRALPNFVQSRTLYVAKLWPKYNRKKKNDRPKTAQPLSRDACLDLARKQEGGSKELLLYVCTELMDVLATRCTCCDEEDPGSSLVRNDRSSLIPWMSAFTGRRKANLDDDFEQFGLSRPRVFV